MAPRLLFVLILAFVVSSADSPSARASTTSFVVSPFGVKYTQPLDQVTYCTNYTWLHGSDYRGGCGGAITPQQLLPRDLTFIQSQHLGSFLRVWVSLDQLFGCWSATTGFCGYDATSLANLDDALSKFAAHGIKIELGMLVWETACDGTVRAQPNQNCFHPEALDGNHAAMRANYLAAVQQFVTHLATDSQDSLAVATIDLQSEAFYQDEVYFNVLKTYPDNGHLGRWDYAMPGSNGSTCYTLGNTVCTGGGPGHGCLSPSNNVDTACIDVNIIEPWLHDLYTTAKAAGPAFPLTVGDSGRLLTTNTGQYANQAHWISLYSPVSDVYDIHLYSDDPWDYTARWATWVNLDKPYFVGEAGCATGHLACTYNAGSISAPLQYWLTHMVQDYGARSVLIEDQRTAWTYSGTGLTQSLTPSGQYAQSLMTVFANAFDNQAAGLLVTGSGTNQFTSVRGQGALVQTVVADSAPNALVLSLGAPTWVSKQYANAVSGHELQIHLELGTDLVIPSTASFVLVRTASGGGTLPGQVQVVLSGKRTLYLTYRDSGGTLHYLWSSATVPLGTWHELDLVESGRGLRLLLDGQQAVATDGLDLGSGMVGVFALGEVSTSSSSGLAGHLFLDDVGTYRA